MSTSIPSPHNPVRDVDQPLTRAFRSFTEAAGSLERTYGHLQSQVSQLRHELEDTNRSLTNSLEENHRIRERLRLILEGLPCGVLVIEERTRVSAMNPEAVRLLGGTFQVVDELSAPLITALEQARQSGRECELAMPTSLNSPREDATNPQPMWVAVRHAWLEPPGEMSRSVFIVRDVSAAKQMERDSEQLRRQHALVEMSALLAHEIRNPLGSLELFAGLLAEADLEGENRRWIEHVQAGLRTLSSTVNNVLDLHNEPPAERAQMDVGELLGWAYDFLMPLAHQSGVEIQIINELANVSIQADRHLIEQVLLNLALNAFKAMSGGGWLSLRGLEDGNDAIKIEVRDSGAGIPEEYLSRIFEPGFSTRPGSSGLGLAVCRRIVEEHGGVITVESRLGHSTTFRLRLPTASGPHLPRLESQAPVNTHGAHE